MRVLVVEDDLDVARQVADTLRQARFVVDVVHDGQEGVFLEIRNPMTPLSWTWGYRNSMG